MKPARSSVDVDVGRRVLQCRCGTARAWTGIEDARAAGWRRTWPAAVGGELAPIWTCPDCAQPPRLPPAPLELLPGYLDDLFNAGRVDLVIEQLELLRLDSAAHFVAYLEHLARRDCPRPRRATWRAFCARHRQRQRLTHDLAAARAPRGRRKAA